MHFTSTHLQQLEYAGVLHDFGKVGVRERVLVKAKKLYEEDLRNIKLRFAYIKKGLEADHAERKLRVALELGKSDLAARLAHIDAELGRRMDEVDDALAFVGRVNEPTVLDQGGFERLVEIARLVYMAPDGELRPYLEPEEVAALQVRRGSLTEVERVEIERHVVTHDEVPAGDPLGPPLRRRAADRGRPPRIPERQRLSQPPAREGHPRRIAHHDHRRHLRRADGVRPAVQESRPDRTRAVDHRERGERGQV